MKALTPQKGRHDENTRWMVNLSFGRSRDLGRFAAQESAEKVALTVV